MKFAQFISPWKSKHQRVGLMCAVLLFQIITVRADNWPQFRGPHSLGISTETGLPVKWSATAVFHLTLAVALHFTGKPVSVEMPRLCGPRNCCQLLARTVMI